MAGNSRQVFEQLTLDLDNTVKQLEASRAAQIAEQIDTIGEDRVDASSRGSEVEVKFVGDDDPQKPVIDLKEGFKRGSSARRTKDGGWYTIVPIRLYTPRGRSDNSKNMTNRLYKQLRNVDLNGASSRTVVSDYLYDNRATPNGLVPELNYSPKSKNITKIDSTPEGSNRNRHTYVAFRTVSDKSHPASWVVNRNSASRSNPTKEVRDIIRAVRRYNRA